jgi:methionyl-tRNA formyltransferase
MCLEALMASHHEVLAVITYPDSFDLQAGPYHEIWYESVKECAGSYQLTVLQPNKVNSTDIHELVERLAPDLIVNMAYGQIYSHSLINISAHGIINLHGSLLPDFKGITPIASALMNGATEVGVTSHFISERIDEGDIILQKKVSISDEDHAMDVFEKTWSLYPELLMESIATIEKGDVCRIPQVRGAGSYYPRRQRSQEQINWDKPTLEVYNFIRALSYPFRGAYTYVEGKQLIVWKVAKTDSGNHMGIPGQIIRMGDRGVIVKTHDSTLEVLEVQAEGQPPRAAQQVISSKHIGMQLGLSSESELISLRKRMEDLELRIGQKQTDIASEEC